MKRFNIYVVLLLSVIILTSIISFTVSIKKPFTLDEVEEARMAEKITKIGPKTFHPLPDGGGEDLSHPLLYTYTNAIFYKLFGSSEYSFRSYGIIFFILSLGVLLLIIKEFFYDSPAYKALLLTSAGLYVINPLLIQHSMVLNADNNISAFAILLYIYLFCYFEKRPNISFIQSRLILACCVAFNFLCKEVTPIFLLTAVIVYRAVNRDLKKLAYDFFLNVLLGVFLFWAIWGAYCLLTNTDILAFIKFTAARKTKKVMNAAFFLRQLKYFFVIWKWPFYWVSGPFFILVFISTILRGINFIKTRALARIDFVMLSSWAMFIPYIFIKPSIDMMKYQYPVYPVFIVLIIWLISEKAGERVKEYLTGSTNIKHIGFLAVILALSVYYYFLGDYIFNIWRKLQAIFIIKYFLPLAVLILTVKYLVKKIGVLESIILSSCLLIFPINIGLNLNQTKCYTTAECWLNYGEHGVRETAQYLRDKIDTRYTVYARKDVNYYLNFRYKLDVSTIESSYVFLASDLRDVVKMFKDNPCQYFVFDRISSFQKGNKDILNLLMANFTVEKKIGDFIVLKNKKL